VLAASLPPMLANSENWTFSGGAIPFAQGTVTYTYDGMYGGCISRDPIAERGGLNLYQYCYSNSVRYRDPLGLVGAGYIVSGSAEGGAGVGLGANSAVGEGTFVNLSPNTSGGDISVGSFAAHGSFVGSPGKGNNAKIPCESNQEPWAAGAYIGIGQGAFFTNADSVNDLVGPFDQYNLNVFGVSISLGISGNTFIASLTVGPGAGASASAYPTTTVVGPSIHSP
jgi:RHS repeat-associated protein